MSLSKEVKKALSAYLLEKISQGDEGLVRKTAENFGVTPATVYKYLDALVEEGAICKIRRGEYALARSSFSVSLRRSEGQLVSEQDIYEDYLRGRLSALPENVRQIWDCISGEMINNIIDHSQAENVTVTLTSDRLNTSLLLTDDGVGIFEKIRAHFGFRDTEEALGELFKGKLTTDAAHHSGEGIFFSSRLADSFVIISSGKVFTRNRFDPDSLSDITADSGEGSSLAAGGTTVYVTLSNSSKKTAADIFDEYADPDGGFTRTGIPVKDFFDSTPVSRSQAKRLCNRLERFREVELDFEGITWMGQGFAHQTFVVFAGEHPEVKLIPLNMCSDVEKMLRHVLS